MGSHLGFGRFTALLMPAFLVLLLGPHISSAQSIEWISQLGSSSSDEGRAIALDGLGNVLVSGRTDGSLDGPNAGDYDAIVAKYDNAGNHLWSRQIGTISDDESHGVGADALGNVYVAGSTRGNLVGPDPVPDFDFSDAFLRKYDAAGNVLWTRQFGTDGDDFGGGVTVDTLGNVYLAGTTDGSLGGPNSGSADGFLSKYDPAGNLVWIRQFGTNGFDQGYGASADGLGNIYVSGSTNGNFDGPNAGGIDAYLRKYDDAGNVLWTRQIGSDQDEEALAISADSLGNVFISGYTWGSMDGPNSGFGDAFVSKYDVAGNLIWTRQLGTNDDDESHSVAADGLGNVYITGYTRGLLGDTHAGITDVFVTKYDGLGNALWTKQFGTSDGETANGLTTDGLGSLYVSGFANGSFGGTHAGQVDVFVAKLSDDSYIPEPSSLALLTLGGFILWHRRRRNC